MFTAHTAGGKRVNLLDAWSRPQLLQLQEREKLLCPVCGGEVRLRLGEQKRFHFAHKRETFCSTYFEPESAYHRHGKQLLYLWFQEQGLQAEVEVYLPSIRQRPDLLLNPHDNPIAIEYQCATISNEQLLKRTRSYWHAGIRVLWILGGSQMKRHAAHWMRLSSLHTLCTQFSGLPYLLYFCPEARAFFKCAPLIPFSTAAVFCHQLLSPLKEASLQELFAPPVVSLPSLRQEWSRKKKQYRANALYPYRKSKDRILYSLYEQGIPLSCFPPEICVPLPSGLAFREPAILWQYRFWQTAFGAEEEGACVRMTERLLSRQPARALPYLPSSYRQQAAHEYLQFLCLTGAISGEGEGVYRKQRSLFVPATEEEANACDEKWIHHALSLFPAEQIVTSRS
ncbi:competence protein CoiA [Ectobacillus ponti]|uniref:Competence protein CoiA family protein n=1 Tax=Ectobacillus ponti TaxID=2961894 RepID=A0AA41X7J3_9BACI|nr:competence protein CoiA family protein [Ectobacillus ponti]MCP8968315.1 competence protein CoiA family protein [Ectobacillus ponti]